MSDDRLARTFDAIDAANARDPNTETVGGETVPKELAYSRRMTEWLDRLAPDAPETLRIAARAQHIERWKSARADYPEGKKGYKLWRFELARMHAERTGEIMRQAGYGDAEIGRVQALLRKDKLRTDPEVQLLEDVICVVFLESYFGDFARKHDEAKIVDILRKTWAKMTPRGHKAALSLEMPAEARRLVEKALA